MEIFVAIYVIQATTHKTSFHDDHSVTRVLHTVTCLGLVFPTEHFSNQFKLGAVITRLYHALSKGARVITVNSHHERFTYQICEEISSFSLVQFLWNAKSRDISEKELA